MKTLILIRHGKSSWDYEVGDKDRPLKERGINDAHLVGEALKSFNLMVDAAFSSPANRALHTAMIVLRSLNFDLNKFEVTNELYDFSGEQALDFLKSLDDNLKTVLIFGHNYAFTNLANTLGDHYIENLPTAGMAQLTFNIENWASLTKGKSLNITYPKSLRS